MTSEYVASGSSKRAPPRRDRPGFEHPAASTTIGTRVTVGCGRHKTLCRFRSTQRDLKLPETIGADLALVIQGVRRCGKSTLMQQLISHYDLDPSRCVFLNFEDPRLGYDLDHQVLEDLVEAFRDRHKRVKHLYFFLDEVQHVDGWQRFIRTQLERPKGNHFIITGSNATLLAGELGSALTGRHITIELFPFSLAEARRVRPKLSTSEYLQLGGFPVPLRDGDMGPLRMQYFSDIIERDLRERLRAPSARDVKAVIQMAYETLGSELSMRRLGGAVGLDSETVKRYMDAAEEAYLLYACPFFAYSKRKSAAYNRKFYPVDSGLWRAVTTPSTENAGKRLEAAVFAALRRRGYKPSYWRGKGEVDFVITKGRHATPIQVTLDEANQRHHRALESFYESFPHAGEAIFITQHNFENIDYLIGDA